MGERGSEAVPGGPTRIVRDANLRVGVRVGPHWVVAWVPEHFPGAASSFLDPASLEVLAVEPGFAPLAWLGGGRLLGWRRNECGMPRVGVYTLSAPGELHTLGRAAGGWKLRQTRPLYHGAPPLAAVIPPPPAQGPHERAAGTKGAALTWAFTCDGARMHRLDLGSGARHPVAGVLAATSCPLRWGPFLWFTAETGDGPRLVDLEADGRDARLVRSRAFPGGGFWFGPVAVGAGRLVLMQDEGMRVPVGRGASWTGTSRRPRLWTLDPDTGEWRRLPVPPVPLDSGRLFAGARLAAVSPDGRWLALRRDAEVIELWPLPSSP